MVKNLPANAGDAGNTGFVPASGRSPGEGMATHSRILAWRISWTEKPGGLQSMGSQRLGQDLSAEHTQCTSTRVCVLLPHLFTACLSPEEYKLHKPEIFVC